MFTISDVAKRAGVSKSSVSRVLNENYEYMSEEMKQKIKQAIQDLNYVPNSVAQSLKKKETRIIGIILAEMAPFWTDVLKGVQFECRKKGYSLMVSDSDMDPKNEETNIQMLNGKQVDGLIINTVNPNTGIFNQLKSKKFPFVFINSSAIGVEADEVVADNISGTTEAIEYLISRGHVRIAILLYPIEKIMVRIERLEAYHKVLKKHEIELDESLIKIIRPEKGNSLNTILQLLSMSNRPTAILSTNINLTLETLKAARQLNLNVPRDISVVGFDDFKWTPLLDPPLTTVAVPTFEMGRQAAALIIKKINSKREKEPKRINVTPKLIIRDSVSVVLKD